VTRAVSCLFAVAALAVVASAQQLLKLVDIAKYSNPVVSFLGDANGDGYPDLVIGQANANDFCGTAQTFTYGEGQYQVISLWDGASLVAQDTWCGKAEGTWVSGAGDWDHDGFDDYVVLSILPTYCRIVVRSGQDGHKLKCLDPTPAMSKVTFAHVGDVDGDGELVLGLPDEGVLGTTGGAVAFIDGGT